MTGARDLPYFAQPFTALAHRGGPLAAGNQGRENTLAAFQHAVGLGYTHVETDVHVTRDGVLVALHDDLLDRVSDRTGAVASLAWHEVAQARIGGEPVPTLDEVLRALPDTCFNIDIKRPAATEPLVRALAEHDAWHRVCVGSFDQATIMRFRQLTRGRVATAVGPVGVVSTAYLPGPLRRLLQGPGRAFQIPMTHRVAGRQVPVLSRELLDAAHARGKVVHVWTVNQAEQMHALVDMGVDGIVTDATDVLRAVLVERGLWGGRMPGDGEQSESDAR